MEARIGDKDASAPLNSTFFTPVKAYHEQSQNKSTTANLNSNEQFSFDKLVSRQKIALKYCSANLNELLASDIKFKSPANAFKLASCTPVKKEWEGSNFFEMVDDFEIDSSFITNKLDLDMSIRKDSLVNGSLGDEDLLHEPAFYLSTNLEFNHPRSSEFSVDECSHARQYCHYSCRQSHADHYYDERMQADDYRKRKRKNNLQLKILKTEFGKCDNWNKDKITEVSKMTGLSESQVYKWCWDQKKKVDEQENTTRPECGKLKTDLNLRPFDYDFNPHELLHESDYAKLKENLAKRKPERKPFTLLPMNRQ
jgi:hypothetical protein